MLFNASGDSSCNCVWIALITGSCEELEVTDVAKPSTLLTFLDVLSVFNTFLIDDYKRFFMTFLLKKILL